MSEGEDTRLNEEMQIHLLKNKWDISGFIAMYIWRSVYWSNQVSLRNRVLLFFDWSKRIMFGRDLSQI